MDKTLTKTEIVQPVKQLTTRRMVTFNTGIILSGAFLYISALFYTKTLAWGIIFIMGLASYNLLQIKQLQNRPKTAAKLWLIPMCLTFTTFPIPLVGKTQPDWLTWLAPVQAILAFGCSLGMYLIFMLEKNNEPLTHKKRPLITQVRIIVQTFIFILYLALTAHSWLTGSKFELFFWGVVNIITAGILPFIFGRAICGWICPNATIQDAVYKNLKFKRPITKFAPWISEQSKAGIQQQDEKGRKEAPYLPATLLISWFAMFFLETIFDLTPVFWYPLAFMLGLFILSLFMPWRKMCTYFCWFSAYRSLASHNSLFRMRIDKNKCRQCKVCLAEKECPFYIDIKNLDNELPATCCVCGNCLEACISPGTIRFGLGLTKTNAPEVVNRK